MTRALSGSFEALTDKMKVQFEAELVAILQEEIARESKDEIRRDYIGKHGFYAFVIEAEFLKEQAISRLRLSWADQFVPYADMLGIVHVFKNALGDIHL